MDWEKWRVRAKAAKQAVGTTDVDLAATLSEVLGYHISRGTVNHWLNRPDREPTISEFIALCNLLKVDYVQILAGVQPAKNNVPPEALRASEIVFRQQQRARRFKSTRRKAHLRP